MDDVIAPAWADPAPSGSPRARYAADPARTRGREFGEVEGGVRGPRSAYQRDRDRIIHSIAFRRLKHKAQVFVAPYGDHYRTRLTHSLEVAQVGRVIARALGLDEDLTEALCLAHDIGHGPFGHAGERALQRALAAEDAPEHAGFDHNAHTLRVLMRLESPYCTHEGLNLSWETLEGLAKHNGPKHNGPMRAGSRCRGPCANSTGRSRWTWAGGPAWRRRWRRWRTTSPMTITISRTASAPVSSRSTRYCPCLSSRTSGRRSIASSPALRRTGCNANSSVRRSAGWSPT